MTISESEKVIRTLYEITSEHSKGFRYQVHRLLDLGCERFNLDIGILAKISGNRYEVVHQVSPKDIKLKEGDVYDFNRTYCAITLEADGPVGFEHVKNSDVNTHPAYSDFALESYIGTPLEVDGKIFGTINFSSPNPSRRKFKKVDLDALQLMASWLGTELSRQKGESKLKAANLKLRELATTDSLTSINNRRAFQQQLRRLVSASKRSNQSLSLLILDLDKFKNYNDKYGHLKGDEILVKVAELLMTNSRGSDLVARFGGEEFAIILPDTDHDGAVKYGDQIRGAIKSHNWTERNITASVGLSTISSEDFGSEDLTTVCTNIVNQADDALYHSKKNGRDKAFHFETIH